MVSLLTRPHSPPDDRRDDVDAASDEGDADDLAVHTTAGLEQRLDAVVLPASAASLRGRRSISTTASSSLVPLRLDKPSTTSSLPIPAEERTGPAPKMLQFIADEGRVGGLAEESVSGIPRLEPVKDSGKATVTVGVLTNVYRLSTWLDDTSTSRPLPVLGEGDADTVETRKLRRVEKVLTLKSIDALDVRVRAFSSSDTDSDIVEVLEDVQADLERAPRAAAALALSVFADEGVDPIVDFADELGGDIDELARQLGLEGTVPRTTPPIAAADLAADVFADIDDVEYIAVTIPTNPMRAVVVSRSLLSLDALDHGGAIVTSIDEAAADDEAVGIQEVSEDAVIAEAVVAEAVVAEAVVAEAAVAQAVLEEGDVGEQLISDDDVVDEVGLDEGVFASASVPPSSSSARPLPSSLLRVADTTGFDDEHEVTPPHGTIRPSLQAPSAVRFFVAEAPARPRRAALSTAELERSRARAHELYLVALDDIACRDVRSAVVHLELALAYDDESPLYHDLLGQLQRKIASKAPETRH
jgi:hypothetical protein